MTKNVSAPSTMTVWATLKYSPVVARINPERRATLGPKRKLATKNRTIIDAKAKNADGILATLSEIPKDLNVRANAP